MTNALSYKFYFKPVGKLTPSFAEAGENIFIDFRHIHMKHTNWSYSFREGMFNSNARYTGFVSGRGIFLNNGMLLIDKNTNEIITIGVKDASGQLFYLVSNKLDTPRCPSKYKSFRSHWRKGLFQAFDRNIDIKIVKTRHDFLQKFILRFNKVPTQEQINVLKKRIYSSAKTII